MTKKEFVALADVIREHNKRFNTAKNIFGSTQIEALADFCQNTNIAFNRERWLAYIKGEYGPSGGKI